MSPKNDKAILRMFENKFSFTSALNKTKEILRFLKEKIK